MAFKNPLYAAIAGLALAGLVGVSISRCGLSDELSEAKAEFAAKTEENTTLKAAIETQNRYVDDLAIQTDAAKARFESAAKAAERQNAALQKSIGALKDAKGETCADAMPLVEEVIGAGKAL